MSVDYSLFMLSRWNEEMKQGRDVFEATVIAMYHTGHTILVSGLTLAACAMGLMLIPMDLLSSLGYTASIVVFCTMLINLTLTPAMLLWDPCGFFSGAAQREHCKYDCGGSARAKRAGVRARGIAPDDEDDDARLLEDDEDDVGLVSWDPATSGRALGNALSASDIGGGGGGNSSSIDGGGGGGGNGGSSSSASSASFSASSRSDDIKLRRQLELLRTTKWYRFGTYLTTGWRPGAAIVLIIGLAAGLAHLSITFDVIGGNMLCFADQSENSTHSIQAIGDTFGYAKLSPYALLVQRDQNSTVRVPSNAAIANATAAGLAPLFRDLKECVDLTLGGIAAMLATNTVKCLKGPGITNPLLCNQACDAGTDLLHIYDEMQTLYGGVSSLVPRFASKIGVQNSSITSLGWDAVKGTFDPWEAVLANLTQCIDSEQLSGGGGNGGGPVVACKGAAECQAFCMSAVRSIYFPREDALNDDLSLCCCYLYVWDFWFGV